MNKKLLAATALVLVIGTSSLFAFGIGIQGGFSVSQDGVGSGSGAVTFKLDSMPWVFAADATFADRTSVGVTADNWIANRPLAGLLNYFYGWGIAGSASVEEAVQYGFIGARVLGGLNVFLLDKHLEFYTQIAWQPGFSIVLSGNSSIDTVLRSFPGAFGFRFWF